MIFWRPHDQGLPAFSGWALTLQERLVYGRMADNRILLFRSAIGLMRYLGIAVARPIEYAINELSGGSECVLYCCLI
jgi:hypothetical protein